MARTDPCLNLKEKSSGRQLVPIMVSAGSSVLLAQDLNAYIDQKLEEFRRQFAGYNLGSTVENQSIFNPAIEQYQIPPGVKLPRYRTGTWE